MNSEQRTTKKEKGKNAQETVRSGRLLPFSCFVVPVSVLLFTGCTWDRFHLFSGPKAPPGPADSLVLRGDKLEPEKAPSDGSAAAELAGAHELYRGGDFATAERIFHRIADNTKNNPQVAEEARYYEAECLRRQERYPKAADTFNKMLLDFPSGAFREQAVQRMFDIANYWLEDTRGEIQGYEEKKAGKRWVVWPSFVHFEKSKPLLDEEGRAIEKLQQVQFNDINGPRAEQALFLAGSVKLFREDYREADHYFTQIVENYPRSQMAPQALEMAVFAKLMSPGGTDYDGRKTTEARQFIDRAFRSYPELVKDKGDLLKRQLHGINMQQAEKDYKIAEFYRRTGHAGSAYFYYEIVRRRYPGTPFFDKATERMHEIRKDVEKKDKSVAAVPETKHESAESSSGGPLLPPPGSPENNMAPGQLPPSLMNR
ncbi:MAG TPA: outer membrane protein assembly factor BamD [Gemmataceae bacterium]|nr:outer membrane protein assembly factor BamD [Gemmataceae bacterium]